MGPSALLQAALVLVPPSTTAAELVARFRDSGAEVSPDVVDGLLTGLKRLGLVRVSRSDGHGDRHVPTSLGQRAIDSGLKAESAVPLEELERLRTELLSTIAHELRTPLTAIRTGVGLLRDSDAHPNEDQRATLLASIERNADRMQRLIGDILELSRFRAGSVALQLRRFSGVKLAQAAVAAVEPLAAKRHQRIELEYTVSDSHAVYGDRRRLEQALLNLIANAQRFSDERGQVRVGVHERDDQTLWSVSDDGPGISEQDQVRLFERFFVGNADRSRRGEGVGLGLPTALAIAQAHGGTIEVHSRIGIGSTFTLVVPTNGPEEDS